MKLSDLEASLRIEKNNLDEENIRQPELYYHASVAYAKAIATWGQADRDKANLAASLDGTLRTMAAERGDKLTEAALQTRIRDMPKMKAANDAIIKAKEQVDLWTGALEALRQRSKHLKELGDLYRANYFQTESSGKDRTEAKDRLAERVREEAGNKRVERVKRDK